MAFRFSVVVPVYNKWELTRRCLVSLAACTPGEDFEVLVADNASTDATATACVPLGRALFGTRFRSLRFERNLNFAGACNRAAREATGERLFFLNNDTRLVPGWSEPLLAAFGAQERLGAVGPLLLYPECDGFPDRVQHLGVAFGPTMQVCHLHEGIPAGHPLARNRRRFQALTAAAVMLSRDLFFRLGLFDEAYVNGFEDLDLCARIDAAGLHMTCVPESRIYHLCGQTPGRGAHDDANSRLLRERCVKLPTPDKHALLEADGCRLRLTPWLTFDVEPGAAGAVHLRTRLKEIRRLPDAERAAAFGALTEEEPYGRQVYVLWAEALEREGRIMDALRVLLLASRFWGTPEILLPLLRTAQRAGEEGAARAAAIRLGEQATLPLVERIRRMRSLRARFRGFIPALAEDADAFLARAEQFQCTSAASLQAALRGEG